MANRLILGKFSSEDDLLGAVRTAMENEWEVLDCHTPYLVEGLNRELGLKKSRLPWFCLFLGIVGAVSKIWFEYWSSAQDWPLNVGGKPWNSLPAFVPITFEVMVLFAGLGTFLFFLMKCRLFPGKKISGNLIGATDDSLLIKLRVSDSLLTMEEIVRTLKKYNSFGIQVEVEDP